MTIQRDWSTGLAAGSTGIAFIGYNGTTKSAGKFDGGTTAPSNTTRLNYDGNLYATAFYGSGAGLSSTTVPIASINASGTPSSTTFLRGDGQWITVSVPVTSVVGQTGAVTATQVRDALLAVDGASSGLDADLLDGQHASAFATSGHTHSGYVSTDVGAGGIGSFALCTRNVSGAITAGSTYAGSSLIPFSGYLDTIPPVGSALSMTRGGESALSGTWRAISGMSTGSFGVVVFQRIA